MKVDDSQGGTDSAVNRKLCLRCGLLEDEKRHPHALLLELDDNVFCTNVYGDWKKNRKGLTLIVVKLKKMNDRETD